MRRLPPGKTAALLNLFLLDDVLLMCLRESRGGAPTELKEYLLKSLELAPSRRLGFDIYHPVGKILYYLRRYEECEKVYLCSIEKNGANRFAYYYLAACREIAGDFETSLKYYRAARRHDPLARLHRRALGRRCTANAQESARGPDVAPGRPRVRAGAGVHG